MKSTHVILNDCRRLETLAGLSNDRLYLTTEAPPQSSRTILPTRDFPLLRAPLPEDPPPTGLQAPAGVCKREQWRNGSSRLEGSPSESGTTSSLLEALKVIPGTCAVRAVSRVCVLERV